MDRYIYFRLASGSRVTLGLTKAKAQLGSMPRGGTRSGCGPTTSTDVYATAVDCVCSPPCSPPPHHDFAGRGLRDYYLR